MASAKKTGEGTMCALKDSIGYFILHESRIAASIESVGRSISHVEQSAYSSSDRRLSSKRHCRTDRLFSSSPKNLAAAM
jgi:hypothetical protein